MPYDGFFGSEAGGWLYPRFSSGVRPAAWAVGWALAAAAVPCVLLGHRCVDRRPRLVIALWFVTGLGAQLALWAVASTDLATAVADGSNGFFAVAAQHGPAEFLRDYRAIAPSHSFHVRANLAGKVLFFHALRAVTDSPRATALLILCVSNLGGVLAYAIARELYGSRRTGHAALVLYLLLPAKVYFLPLMNTVTPVFIMVPLWLLMRFCASGRPAWLVAVGVSLYWLVLFDPVPLVTGLVFLAVLRRACARKDVNLRGLAVVLVVVPATFVTSAWLVDVAFGYDIAEALRFAVGHASEFNELNQRPYGLWLVQNLIDFFVNTGVGTSAIFLVVATVAVRRPVPERVVPLSVLAVVLVLDALGVNRGEVIRLWIFLGAFVQFPVAGTLAERPRVLAALTAAQLLQACAAISTREFVALW
ncbi:hypothetical protein [Gemmata sp.]|uniref:hypothetical protein n=1 Tax=Gemmata sp. TaxID=1914242 RepID=UPI003F6F604D